MDASSILPVPIPDEDSQHYWEVLGEGRFELQRCHDCERWTWPPRPVCSGCHGENLYWEAPSGAGEVHAWIVTHQIYGPGYGALVPYTVALVRLDEQPDILVPGRYVSGGSLHQGLRVRIAPRQVDGGLGVPEWRSSVA